MVIKTDQRKRPETDPHTFSYLVFDKGTKALQCVRNSLFKQLDIHTPKKFLNPFFISYAKIKSKGMLD